MKTKRCCAIFGLLVGCSTDEAPDSEEPPDASCAAFESPVPTESRSQFEAPPTDLRNYRYCEVLPAFAHGDRICVEVYNTLGFNDCPEQDWAALEADALVSELGAENVFLNGPRHWVINGAVGDADPTRAKIARFGTLQMSRPGLLELASLADLPSTDERYRETEVARSNTWFYTAGNEVYELTSESGEVYIMQSYSRILDPDLSIEDLPNLATRLTLPDGWTFSSRILEADYELVSDGVAFVIQDDLANTYQRR